MSEEDYGRTRDAKRAAREEKRAEKRRAIEERNAEQREEIEDLIDERELDPDQVVIVPTDLGMVACMKASANEISRFFSAVNKAPSGRRGKAPDAILLTQGLVRSAVIYPASAEFEAILKEYPMVWNTLGDGLVELAGGSFEADVRKN